MDGLFVIACLNEDQAEAVVGLGIVGAQANRILEGGDNLRRRGAQDSQHFSQYVIGFGGTLGRWNGTLELRGRRLQIGHRDRRRRKIKTGLELTDGARELALAQK